MQRQWRPSPPSEPVGAARPGPFPPPCPAPPPGAAPAGVPARPAPVPPPRLHAGHRRLLPGRRPRGAQDPRGGVPRPRHAHGGSPPDVRRAGLHLLGVRALLALHEARVRARAPGRPHAGTAPPCAPRGGVPPRALPVPQRRRRRRGRRRGRRADGRHGRHRLADGDEPAVDRGRQRHRHRGDEERDRRDRRADGHVQPAGLHRRVQVLGHAGPGEAHRRGAPQVRRHDGADTDGEGCPETAAAEGAGGRRRRGGQEGPA